MLIGIVEKIGDDLVGKIDLKVGDKIVIFVFFLLIFLRIDEIINIKFEIDRVEIKGKVIFFESGIYVVLLKDMFENLVLVVFDVVGVLV